MMQNHLLNNPVFEIFFLRQLKHVNPCIFRSVVIQNKTENEERNKLLFSQYPLRMCTNGKWKNRISANCLTPGSHRMQKVRDIYVQYVCVRACMFVRSLGHEPTALDTVEAFHPQKKKWERLAPMMFPRCSTSSIVIRDRLLIVGGVNQVNNISTDHRCHLLSPCVILFHFTITPQMLHVG